MNPEFSGMTPLGPFRHTMLLKGREWPRASKMEKQKTEWECVLSSRCHGNQTEKPDRESLSSRPSATPSVPPFSLTSPAHLPFAENTSRARHSFCQLLAVPIGWKIQQLGSAKASVTWEYAFGFRFEYVS